MALAVLCCSSTHHYIAAMLNFLEIPYKFLIDTKDLKSLAKDLGLVPLSLPKIEVRTCPAGAPWPGNASVEQLFKQHLIAVHQRLDLAAAVLGHCNLDAEAAHAPIALDRQPPPSGT